MKKSLAIVLMVLCAFSVFAQGQTETAPTTTAPVETPAVKETTPAPVVEKAAPKKMVYATSSFGMKFSPFFAATELQWNRLLLPGNGIC